MLRLMAKDYLPPMGLLPPTPIVLLTLFLRLCLDKAQWKRISDGAGTKSQTPALCLSHFALQITVHRGYKNKSDFHDCPPVLYKGWDGKN